MNDYRWRILIIEDNRDDLALLNSILHKQNYWLAVAFNAREALSILHEYSIDLILMDISLPGIDGIELCRQLKADPVYTEIPTLFLSASVDQAIIDEALEAGGLDYVTKPFDHRELLARIESQINILESKRELEQVNRDLASMVKERTRELNEKNQALEKTLQQRTFLLQEVYHRVNNNLQFIQSLVAIDIPKSGNPEIAGFIKKFNSRIRTMAQIQGLLLHSKTLNSIDMTVFLSRMFLAERKDRNIDRDDCSFELPDTPMMLEINQAFPFGIALTEIFRHFIAQVTPGKKGEIFHISVTHEQSEKGITLRIRFDGAFRKQKTTLPSETDLLIITSLIEEQLEGKYATNEKECLDIHISFPYCKLEMFHPIPAD